MNFKERVKSLTVLRRQYLEEIIAFLTTRPYLTAIFNLFIIATVRSKRFAAEAGGLAEDIREGIDGHIFSKGSKEELSTILLEIDNNPSFYQEMRSIDTGSIRSVEDQVEELVSLYKTCGAHCLHQKGNS